MKGSRIRRLSFVIAIGMLVFGNAAVGSELTVNAKEEERGRKLNAMIEKTGTVITIKVTEIGKVFWPAGGSRTFTYVSCIEVTDVFTGAREIGITFGTSRFSTRIDYDEIESLLRGMDYFSKLGLQVPPVDSLQVIYKTSSGNFSMSYNRDGNFTLKVDDRGFDSRSASEFRTLIFQAKQKLDKMK